MGKQQKGAILTEENFIKMLLLTPSTEIILNENLLYGFFLNFKEVLKKIYLMEILRNVLQQILKKIQIGSFYTTIFIYFQKTSTA